MIKNLFRTLIILLLIITVPFPAYADFGPIQIDGYYDDWEDKPHVDVYNGSKPSEKKVNKVSLVRDEDNIYVHVKFARKNNQGITNMIIDIDTDQGDKSFFLFPDLWFNGMDMSEQNMTEMEMMPEETPSLTQEYTPALTPEDGSVTDEGSGSEVPDQPVTTEPESGTEPTDQNTETEQTDQNPVTEQEVSPESTETVSPETTETTDQIPDTTDQGGAADEAGDSTGKLYSNLDQSTYTVSDNANITNYGQSKKLWNGTWSFTVWKTFSHWHDWEDWDGWDDWEDWNDWEDLFNPHDVQDWNNWFDWDDWAPVGSGYYTRNEGDQDELELSIPLSAITRNYDGITEISMKIKKLGQQTIICTGVDSGAFVGVTIGAGIAMLSVGTYTFKRKRSKTDQC